ncbi:MAG: autotransporter-associated beta strand repeat-containing protein [Fibrobacterota bacterium]|nr:MAG: autotransporter-associated beta strand repeat-containing protein [Fibrobacterota bacterium]
MDIQVKDVRREGPRRLVLMLWMLLSAQGVAWCAAPTITDLYPPNGARMVVGRQPMRVQLSAPIQVGTGSIVIRRSSDNSILETIPATSPTVSVNSPTLLHGFEAGAEEFDGGWGAAKRTRDTTRAHTGKASLAVTIDADWNQAEAVYGPMSQDWSGMDSVVFWAYSTQTASVEPVSHSGTDLAWAVGRTAATLAQNTWTRVSMPLSGIPTPRNVIAFGFNLSPAGTYWFDDVGLVKSGADQLTFLPGLTFPKDNSYYVNIEPTVVKEAASGQNFGGILDATTWVLRADASPTAIQLSKASVDENLPTGSTVGELSSSDPDGGTTFFYTLVSGTGSTDNASFSISGTTLKTAAILDYESKPSLSVRIRSTDLQGAYFESPFAISVQNLSDRTTWDVSTNAGIQSGNGSWGSDNFWTKNGTTLGAWPGQGNTAEFSGSDGTWTVNLNGTMQADSVVFTAAGFTLSGGILNLNASSPAIVANADATIASNIAGQYAKLGAAKLTLNANNTGTWSYTHKAGTTLAKTSGTLGTGNVVIDGSGRLQLGNGTVFSNPLTITSCNPDVGNGALSPDSGASAEWSGPLAVNANCTYGGTIAGARENSGTLTLSGSLNMGGSATSIRQRRGIVVYKGGGGATNFELIEGNARLGANNGLPPNAIWTQPHAAYGSILELNGFNQIFQAVHSASTSGITIRNSSGTQSTLGVTGNIDTTFYGVVSGNVAIAKSGSGRQTFSGTNTFQGPVAISGGTLRLGNAKALGDFAGATTVSGNGALDLSGQAVNDAEPLTLSGTGPSGAGALVNGATATATFAGPVALSGNATVAGTAGAIVLTNTTAITGNTSTLTLAGSTTGNRLDAPISTTSGGLTKSGSGTWTLRGLSTYAGPTTVGAGTLCVAGSLAAASAVSVGTGATLCGTGNVGGAIAVKGGIVATGTPDSIGKLSAQSVDLSKDSASTLRIRLQATNKPGIDYDRLELSGALVLGGKSVLDLDLSGLNEQGTASGIVTAGSVTGQFSSVKVRNNPHNLLVVVVYKSALVNVTITRIAPSFTKGPAPTVLEDAPNTTITGWAKAISGGTGATGQSVGFRTGNSHPSLFSTQPSVASDGTLSFSPASDSNGTAVVRIRLGASDNPDSSALDSFTINVTPVNDPPRFSKGSDLTMASDTVERTLAGWTKSISAGPPDEAGQKTSFRLSHTKPALYTRQPSLSSDGTLGFTAARGADGTDTVHIRLGDDGGTADGGRDSSSLDTFFISLRPLSLRIHPDTLKLLLGDTGRFRAILSSSNGTDSTLAPSAVAWSWSTSLGDFSSGLASAHRTGSTRVFARFQGSVDSAVLVVSELDTTLAPSTDSVKIRAGHGITATIPPHTGALMVSIGVSDSSLSSKGISGADSAILASIGNGDTIRIRAPVALIPSSKQRPGETPSVFWMDSTGTVHLVPSVASSNAVVFDVFGKRAWWLGYDTVAPTVGAIHSSDSISTDTVRVRWSAHDNVAGHVVHFCLQKAGQTVSCPELGAGGADSGNLRITRQDLPLGGRYWIEARDSRTTAHTDMVDIVVRLDTLKSSWSRTEDRYELLALPYVRGTASAHPAFQAQWGEDDPRHWRVFAGDSGKLQDVLAGDPMDAAGRSFWVRTRERPLVPWIAGRWTTPMSQMLRSELQPGWNAVGNPLGFDLSWRQIWRLAGADSSFLTGPYEFDGATQGWSIPDTTKRWGSWKGAAIFNRSERTVELRVPSVPDGGVGSSSARKANAVEPPLLRLSVQASQAGSTSSPVWMGVDRVHRAWKLPPSPRWSLQTSVEDPKRPGSALLSDVRTPADSGNLWTLRVTGLTPHQPLTLRWARTGSDTSSVVWIRDDKSSRWLSVAEQTELTVGEEGERSFQVLAGAILGPRAPRPFSVGLRGAALFWSLPDRLGRTHVRIEAFDPRGRRLAGFVDEQMDPGSYGRPFRLSSPTGQILLVLTAGTEQTSTRWLIRP